MRVSPFRDSLAASLGVLLFCALPSAAQERLEARIDRLISAEMRNHKVPGLSLAVIRNGRVTVLKSYGLANVEHQVPVKPETVFQSGSMGKQFTAAAVMILAEEGKISLENKITKFFPDAPADVEQHHGAASPHAHVRNGGLPGRNRSFYPQFALLESSRPLSPLKIGNQR